MALRLEEIRALAERVAASHSLEVVDVEYQGGGGKHRTLRVFIEKNEAERAGLRERVARLQAERAARRVEGEDAGMEDEPSDDSPDAGSENDRSAEAGDARAEGGFSLHRDSQHEEEEAFLDGLPSVANLELLSGITHEDCELFSRDFGTVLDVEELGPGTEYLLEVSSPGLDRRLTRVEDYRRFTGSLVKLQTFEAVGGNRHWEGRIAVVSEGRLALEMAEKKRPGKQSKKSASLVRPASVEIALSNIEKAQLVPEF